MRASGGRDKRHEFAEEFGGVIRMDDVGGDAAEIQLVE